MAARYGEKLIHLHSGGWLRLSGGISFLSLSKRDREFVFFLIDAMSQYEEDLTPDQMELAEANAVGGGSA